MVAFLLGSHYQGETSMSALHFSSRILCAFFLVAPMLAPAHAKVVSYNFSASIEALYFNIGDLGDPTYNVFRSIYIPDKGNISEGEIITGTLTYDTLSPNHGGPTYYETTTAAPTLTYSVGNTNWHFTSQGPQRIVLVHSGDTRFEITSPGHQEDAQIWLEGPESSETPSIPDYLKLNDFSYYHGLQIYLYSREDGYPSYQIDSQITFLTMVPEPTAFALVGAGLLCIGLRYSIFKCGHL